MMAAKNRRMQLPEKKGKREKREKETERERVRRSIGDIFTEPYDRLFKGKRV